MAEVTQTRGKASNGEGSVYQKADGRWEARLSVGTMNGKARYKWVTGKTKREAEAKKRAVQANLERGIMPGNDRQSVKAFLADWLADKKETVRPATYRSYADTVRLHIEPQIGHKILTKLTPQDVRKMLSDLATGGMKPPSVRYTRTVLRAAVNQAKRWELVSRNVAELVTPPKVARHEARPLTVVQAKTLLKAVKNDRHEGIFTVALMTGLRQGEILGLMWDDLDLPGATLTLKAQLQRVDGVPQRVPLKTEQGRRTISLPAPVVTALNRERTRQKQSRLLAGSRWRDTGFVFTTSVGTPHHASNVIGAFHDALERTELPRTNFHSMRHSAASFLLAMGASSREIMEALGHTQIGTTMNIYAHLMPEAKRETAVRMERAFEGIG